MVFCKSSFAQDIVGEWLTYDDKTEEKKSVVQIYKEDDIYSAMITELFTAESDVICGKCSGSKKDQRILGLVIIENLVKDGDEYNGGSILDPESGETYKCYLELVDNSQLKVRGYIGVSIFGRTQYWQRKR